jgi:simple sugar transport system ATP-binding protein
MRTQPDDAREAPVARLTGVTKRFAGVTALSGVDFAVAPGEIRALLGKNGAGKSTLIRVLSGAHRPDAGHVELLGEGVELRSPADALARGVVTVYQELSIVPEMSVAENVVLGRWPRVSARGPVDLRGAREQARKALAAFDHDFDLDMPAGRLSIADQQLVEIARAISRDARLLILDEPTSSLASHEAQALLETVRRIAGQGVAVIYISHRLNEVVQIADTATVVRDGIVVATVDARQTSIRAMAELMFGDTVETTRRAGAGAPPAGPARDVVLSVRGLRVPPKVRDVSFELRRGEVLGIAGLLGTGRTEILRAIAGADPRAAGEIVVDGRAIRRPTLRTMLGAGVVLTPEDRRREGIVPLLGVDENIAMTRWPAVTRAAVVSPQRVRDRARGVIDRLAIRTASPATAIGTLSGGSQQKVVIGKWLDEHTRVLLLDEPTRGVDIHAKEQIYDIVRALAAEGLGVVFVSSEFEELCAVCDRLLVLRDGRIAADVTGGSVTPGEILDLAVRDGEEVVAGGH